MRRRKVATALEDTLSDLPDAQAFGWEANTARLLAAKVDEGEANASDINQMRLLVNALTEGAAPKEASKFDDLADRRKKRRAAS